MARSEDRVIRDGTRICILEMSSSAGMIRVAAQERRFLCRSAHASRGCKPRDWKGCVRLRIPFFVSPPCWWRRFVKGVEARGYLRRRVFEFPGDDGRLISGGSLYCAHGVWVRRRKETLWPSSMHLSTMSLPVKLWNSRFLGEFD